MTFEQSKLHKAAAMRNANADPREVAPILEKPHLAREMTLRDWFAGMAMQGYLANPEVFQVAEQHGPFPVFRAQLAYEIADEMLKAREG